MALVVSWKRAYISRCPVSYIANIALSLLQTNQKTLDICSAAVSLRKYTNISYAKMQV